jgi:hypothetical protein
VATIGNHPQIQPYRARNGLGTALALVLSVLELSLQIHQERNMNTPISSKLAAFAIALMMNSLLIGGVSYLFNNQNSQAAMVVAHAAWA